jgi:hypothetical protein
MKSILTPILTGFILLSVVSCNESSSGVSSKAIASFADRSDLIIPPTAKATDHRRTFSRDGEILLRLEIPAGDLAEFLTKSGLDGELNNTSGSGPATSYLGDFLPAHPTKFREGQKSLSGGEFLNVLVDEDSPTTTVIYLQWFGT